MKRVRIIICAMLCLLISSALLLTGCFGGGTSDSDSTSDIDNNYTREDIEVTLIGENGNSEEITVTTNMGLIEDVPAMYKDGYYFNGYFDSQEGGKQYFNSKGYSTSVWQANYPTTLYAQFKPVSELFYEQNNLHTNDPWTVGTGALFTVNVPIEFQNAANANYEREVKMTITYRYKTNCSETDVILNIIDSNSGDNEVFFTKSLGDGFDANYQTVNVVAQFPARCIRKGTFYIDIDRMSKHNLEFAYGPTTHAEGLRAYIKELSYQIEFV